MFSDMELGTKVLIIIIVVALIYFNTTGKGTKGGSGNKTSSGGE